MSIVKYTGQPLPPGTIICRESALTIGICSCPVMVVMEGPRTVTFKDLSEVEERRRAKSSIAFICGTEAEGWVLFEASKAFAKAEQALSIKQAKEKAVRKQQAIEWAMLKVLS